MHRFDFAGPHERDERGQILVIFAAALVVIVAMVGLILDGGSAFAQRRSQQNASDLAALAGANAYLLTNDANVATNAAKVAAADNGWTDGTDSTTVDVTIDPNTAEVTVVVGAPHDNNFGAIVGLDTMDVATTATALAGFPDRAEGAAPMIFSIEAFGPGGVPLAQYADPENPFEFGDTNNHAPTGPGDFAWTNYGTGNVSSNDVKSILAGTLVISKTLDFGEYIGQHNNGNHSSLFDNPGKPCNHPSGGSINTCLAGLDVPVPVVDNNGNFMGWATFHVVSAEGGSTKKVTGYFLSSFVSERLTIGGCQPNADCPQFLGTYVLKLVD